MSRPGKRKDAMTGSHIERLAGVYGERHYGIYGLLAESLRPRSPRLLFDVAAEYLRAGDEILDIGCRDGSHLVTLAKEHDIRGVGIDPLDRHVGLAEMAVNEAGFADRITITKGVIEHLDFPDLHFDFVWCRDVLTVVEGLHAGVAETARVLKKGGHMLVYMNFATELLERHEAKMLNEPLGNVEANMDEQNTEAAFQKAGFVIERKDVIGTEWREYEEERDKPAAFDLLRLARLRRQRDTIVSQHGQELFDLAQASLHWLPYQLLGKLRPVMYVLRK